MPSSSTPISIRSPALRTIIRRSTASRRARNSAPGTTVRRRPAPPPATRARRRGGAGGAAAGAPAVPATLTLRLEPGRALELLGLRDRLLDRAGLRHDL